MRQLLGILLQQGTLGLILALVSLGAAAGTLRIGGTGAALGGIERVAEAYAKAHPGSRIVVLRPAVGSDGGIKALQSGVIDLAVSGRPLKEEECARGLSAREYAKTPLVVAVGKGRSPPAGLTLQALADIYAGRTVAWPDGRPLRLILRPPAEAETLLLRALSPEMDRAVTAALARKGMILAITDQDSADTLEKVPGAVGTSSLALILSENRALHALPLDGVEPTVEALADGRYPYGRSLYLVTGPRTAAEARRFAEFLASPAAQAVLRRNGHWVEGGR